MKLAKSQLNQIIKEELETVLSEVADIDGTTGLPTTTKGLKACAADEECADRVTMTNRDIIRDPAIKTAVTNTDSVKYARAAWQKTHTARDAEYDAALAQDPQGDARGRTDQSVAADDPRTRGTGLQGDLPPAEQDIERVTDIEQLHDMAKTFAEKGDVKLAAAAKKRALAITPPSMQQKEAEKRAQEDYDWAGNLLGDVDEFLHAMEGDLEVYEIYSGELEKAMKGYDDRGRRELGDDPESGEPYDIPRQLKEQKTLGRWKILAGVR